jgi:anti-anti-sigma factor
MQFTEQRFGNALLLKITGRIDRDSSDSFNAALQPHLENCKIGGNVLLLDFSAVQYMSTLGFQVLLRAQQWAKKQSGSFAVAALQGGVKDVFTTANFAKVIRYYESVETALAEMSYSAYTAYTQAGK